MWNGVAEETNGARAADRLKRQGLYIIQARRLAAIQIAPLRALVGKVHPALASSILLLL